MDTIAQDQIRRMRGLKGLTLQELGERTGINYTWLSRIERGRVVPTGAELERIQEALRPDNAELRELGLERVNHE